MKGKVWEYFLQVVPAFGVLRGYTWKALGSDALAGITVATVAIPQAMAYAILAGVDPRYGLYTAIVMTLVGALFDSSRQLINGPTNAISIAVFSALAFLPAEQRVPGAILLAFLVGAVQITITLFRLGDLTRFVSHGVIVGFTVGAGTLVVLSQLPPLLGIRANGDPHDHFLKRLWETLVEGSVNAPSAAIGLGAIAFVVAVRLAKRGLPERYRFLVPEFLLAVGLSAAAVWAFDLEAHGVRAVGRIPPTLPAFQLPAFDWTLTRHLGGSALAIALLGLLEAIAMAKAIAARTRQKLDINQQCLSEGLANVAGSFFQCFPGSGSLTRSAINQQAGAVSQWSGVIAAAAVAGVVLLLGPLAAHIPYAALAGILMVSAWSMVDKRQLLYHVRATWFDAGIVLITALSAIFISVEFCILIGVFLSFVLYVPKAARLDLTELTVTPERVLRERQPGDPPCGRLLIYNLEGELFFGSAPALDRHFDTLRERVAGGGRIVVLRLKNARNPDAVCLAHFEQFIRDMDARRVHVLLCGVRPEFHRVLRNTGLEALLGPSRIFEERPGVLSSTLDAVRHAYELLNGDYCATCPKRDRTTNGQEGWYYMI